MGIINEATKQGVTYFYDSKQGKTSSNHVISVLDKHLFGIDLSKYNDLYMTFDNCPVNKNYWISGYFFSLIKKGSFDLVDWGCPLAGHTKFGPDGMFGWLGPHLLQYDLFEVSDAVKRANQPGTPRSYTAVQVKPEELKDFKTYVDFFAHPLTGINKFHRFRMRKDIRGKVIMEAKYLSEDPIWVKCTIFKKQTLSRKCPKMLPIRKLSDAKLKDLQGLEKFVPGNKLSYAH